MSEKIINKKLVWEHEITKTQDDTIDNYTYAFHAIKVIDKKEDKNLKIESKKDK